MSRWFVLFGILLVVIGSLLHFHVEVPWLTGWIGKLPGDLIIKKGDVTIYVPLATSFVVSLILSIFVSLLFKRN